MPRKKETFAVEKRADIDYTEAFNNFIRGLDNQGFKNLDLEPGQMIKIKETTPPFMGDWPVTILTEMFIGEDSVVFNMSSSNFGYGPIQKKHCVKIHNYVKNRLMIYLEGELPADHFIGGQLSKAAFLARKKGGNLPEPEAEEELPEEIEEYEELPEEYEEHEEEDFSEYEELLRKEAAEEPKED
ncbi:MAG: hypothetical protein IJO79_01510 [Firmicutes bacterium]|nr:hypothetical protein [Bacillota bacterium]